jgi:hypothetical protein
MENKEQTTKRINLILPIKLYDKVKDLSQEDNRSVNNYIVNTLEKNLTEKK